MAHWRNIMRERGPGDPSHPEPCKHKSRVIVVLERLRRFGHTVATGVVILSFFSIRTYTCRKEQDVPVFLENPWFNALEWRIRALRVFVLVMRDALAAPHCISTASHEVLLR